MLWKEGLESSTAGKQRIKWRVTRNPLCLEEVDMVCISHRKKLHLGALTQQSRNWSSLTLKWCRQFCFKVQSVSARTLHFRSRLNNMKSAARVTSFCLAGGLAGGLWLLGTVRNYRKRRARRWWRSACSHEAFTARTRRPALTTKRN